MRWRWAIASPAIVMAISLPACVQCTATDLVTGIAAVRNSGDVSEKDNNSEVGCTCEVVNHTDRSGCSLGGFAPGKLVANYNLCLPPELNPGQDAGVAALSDAVWKTKVNQLCQTRMPANALKLAAFLTKKGCESNCFGAADVQCFVSQINGRSAVAANPVCSVPCDVVPCSLAPGAPTCNSDSVVHSDGTVDPGQCKCTQITEQPWSPKCGAAGSSDVFCINPPGNQDPPTIRSGGLTTALSAPNLIEIDHAQSSMNLAVGFDDGVGIHHSDNETFSVGGTIMLYGLCSKGAACDMRLDMRLLADDVTFKFSNVVCGVTCLQDINVLSSRGSILGGMASTTVHIDPGGFGHIPVGTLLLHGEVILSGIPDQKPTRQIFDDHNDRPIDFNVDFSTNSFSISGSPFTVANGNGSLTLMGKIVNQPPRAKAGANQILECSSPVGANATLDGAASFDPNNDIFDYEWWQGPALFGDANVASGPTVTVTAPFVPPSKMTQYELSVADSRLAVSVAKTAVTVQDTTPPTLEVSATPDCLWPPNHKMVLYGLGAGLLTAASDVCDPKPSVRIVNVTSNQPVLGGGSGNTTPDVSFGDAAFCVRSEREGTVATDREYTVTVEARDASGNTTTKQAVVRVHHDQGPGKCALVDPSRVVDDGDPRCSANQHSAVVHMPPTPEPPSKSGRPVPPSANPSASASSVDPGCSVAAGAGAATPRWGWFAGIGLAFASVLRRSARDRRRQLQAAGAVLVLALAAGCGKDSSNEPPPLETRVTGWWIDPQPGGCYCPSQPECRDGDCVGYAVLGLLPDKRYLDGHVAVSKATGTMSSMGTLSTGTWRVDGQTVVVSQSKIPDLAVTVTFNGARMQFGSEVEASATPDLIGALGRATAGGNASWSSVPVGP